MKCLCLCKCACECMCVCITITYLLSCEWYYAPFSHLLSCSIYLCHLFCDSISSWRATYKGQSGKLRWGLYTLALLLGYSLPSLKGKLGLVVMAISAVWRVNGVAVVVPWLGFVQTNTHRHTHICMHNHAPMHCMSNRNSGLSGIKRRLVKLL